MDKEVMDRLVLEFNQLNDRLEKLSNFIDSVAFNSLDHVNRFLLRSQELAMKQYRNVLNERISINSKE